MKEKEILKSTGSDRRGFLKTAALGAGVGAAALVGIDTAAAAAPVPKWDKEVDVVVVGFGGAGAAAAIEAHDAGSKVLIIEKMPGAGGSTAMSEGGINIPKVPLDLEGSADYFVALGFGRVERDYALTYVKEASSLPDFINRKLGGDLPIFPSEPYHPTFKGASNMAMGFRSAMGGAGLFKVLSAGVESRQIPVLFETAAKELLADGNGDLNGVLAEGEDGSIRIKARKGVVLSCGGFPSNETLKLDNLRVSPVFNVGNPGNTGDAITLAAKFGAQLWKMPEAGGCLCHRIPGVKVAAPSGFQINWALLSITTGMILVNKYGKRFTNENAEYDTHYMSASVFDPIRNEYTNVPCWFVFDEETRKIGPVGHSKTWSADNSKEIESGLIVKGGTIAELGQKAGIDPAALEITVKSYNGYCEAGHDPEFRRENRRLEAGQKLVPLASSGPYYALQAWPGLFETWGGPKINTKGQILDVHDKVIPRLYAAGDASHATMGFWYQGGNGVGNALAFGRITGRNVAAESTRRI